MFFWLAGFGFVYHYLRLFVVNLILGGPDSDSNLGSSNRGGPVVDVGIICGLLVCFGGAYYFDKLGVPAEGLRWTYSLGMPCSFSTLLNVLAAELLTNFFSFCLVVPNHAGEDLWYFPDCSTKADSPEFYVRACLASTGYHSGTDLIDYMSVYVNYQAEHHCFPNITPLHYQRLHPKFKKVCEKYGVPLIEQSVAARVVHAVNIIVGKETNKRMPGNAVDHPELWMLVPQQQISQSDANSPQQALMKQKGS